MALDGMMLSLLRRELESRILCSRVDKIHQPTKEELILALRSQSGNVRLLLSSRVAAPRVQLTALTVENPKQPPMFCMLLRKWIGNAKLIAIRQPGMERVLLFDFETTNDFGDTVAVTLAAEIMGRYSNLILIGPDGRIVDSVRRVGADRSSLRQILPGLFYENPPAQDRVDLIEQGAGAVCERLFSSPRDIDLAKLLQETVEGASPILCRELVHRAFFGQSLLRSEACSAQREALQGVLTALAEQVRRGESVPTMVLTPEGEPKDFSFLPIEQYDDAMKTAGYPRISELLDAFYGELCAQKEELIACRDRDRLRRCGDLLSASLYRLEKGMASVTLDNYFDESGGQITIELDPRLTPVQNVQKYYKDYRRADTAERMLKDLIAQGEQELAYLETVYDLMTRARTEEELNAIRAELAEGGYLRAAPGVRRKQENRLPPLRYRSSDGFVILSGRNNLQNDRLTLRESRGNDIWFHVQKIPGSHTVLLSEGREIPNRSLTEAAVIAAVNSKARHSSKVPVDYTMIKNVKKQPGGKPGMVIYENFRTAVVDPDEILAERLAEKL